MDVVFSVIRDNLCGFTFDMIIIFIGAVNGSIFIFMRQKTKKLCKILDLNLDRTLPIQVPLVYTHEELQRIENERKSTERLYSLYVGITSIFPFLGVLGTVFSLIMLAGGDVSLAVQESFFVALTSTFWGVLFAIFYRFLDATVSIDIHNNNDRITRLKFREEEKIRNQVKKPQYKAPTEDEQ